MKVLFLTNLLPYPLDNGGKIKTYATLKALSDNNAKIDLLCCSESLEKDYKNIEKCPIDFNSVEMVENKLTTYENLNYMIKLAFKSLFLRFSFGVYKYKNKDMYRIISEKMKEDYDIIYFEHLQLFIYYKYIKKLCKNANKTKFILDEQNCESLIMKRTYQNEKKCIKKVFCYLEYLKLLKFEKKALIKSDHVFTLSEEDYTAMRNITRKDFNKSILPIAIQDSGVLDKKINSTGKLKLLFIGTLTWNPNNQGIIWFVKNVIPLLNKCGFQYELYIVGKNPSKELQKLCEQESSIVITGYAESLDTYYENCDFMIIPLFIGGGQRVKLIEAMSKGMPVISTSIGAEGLLYEDNQNILIADNDEAFMEKINIIQDPELYAKIARNSRKTYEEEYSMTSYSKKFNCKIQELLQSR